eukprot:805441-Prymnesium_polylepis.1
MDEDEQFDAMQVRRTALIWHTTSLRWHATSLIWQAQKVIAEEPESLAFVRARQTVSSKRGPARVR